MPFHNPYHFVPVKPGPRLDDLSVSNFEKGNNGHVTHDRFVSRTGEGPQAQPVYSGRLICRLTIEDPIVIGDQREKLHDGSHRVSPFMLQGKPAIPATTLRGLISSIAEAASNSALRVLDNRLFSYRAEIRAETPVLSAVGMIVEVKAGKDTTELRLRPLGLPTMTMEGFRGGAIPLENRYRKMFPLDRIPPLKVYVGNSSQIRSDSFVPGLPLRSFSRDHVQYCYAKLHVRRWSHDHTLPFDSHQYRKAGERGPEFLLGQKTTDELPPCLENKLPQDQEERKLHTRGILRILGVPGREDIPNTKKHELFIPYPEDIEDTPTFPIPAVTLERFYKLADERTEARKEGPPLPYEPWDTSRNRAPDSQDDKRFRLKDGDLVYFRPDSKGEAVDEIALSAIWRREAGTSYDYFRQLSPEILPFHKDRQQLTIAEQLFGFVELLQEKQRNQVRARALASRLRFSFGLLHENWDDPYKDDPYEDEILLKVLDSPKPPSPALYFKRRNEQGAYISKSELKLGSHVPQGRKYYLHRRGNTGTPWKTLAPEDDLKQKNRVRPLRPGRVFYFHIDFENLSQRELGLLCYAVRPTNNFRHKIGMGKSIGLGKVCIDPVGLFYIDRYARYRETALFEVARYYGSWRPADENPAIWPDRYSKEKLALGRETDGFPSFDTHRQHFRESMNLDIRQALELLGDPEKVRRPVHTPQVAGVLGRDTEKETYRWFVANDLGAGTAGAQKEFLKPLDKSCDNLPTLSEHPWNK